MEKLIKGISKVLLYIAAILVFFMIAIITINVILRYFFHKSIYWSVEISDYTMIWSVFLASASLLCNDDHLKINALESALKGNAKKALKIVGYAIIAIFGIWLTSSAVKFVASTGNQTVSTVRWLPMNFIYIVIPVSGVMFTLICILKIIDTLTRKTDIKGGNE